MLKKFAAALLCTVAPVALCAEPVELRSTDGFISVEGEIVGFNGVMLSVATSVGLVSVPASEVICFGPGCQATLDTNDFGLTASAFQAVAVSEVAVVEDLDDNFVVSFDNPVVETLFRTLAGAFAVASQTTSSVDLTSSGQLNMQNQAGNETATLTTGAPGTPSDLAIETTSLRGSAATAYSGAQGWATASRLDYQMIGLDAFAVVINPDIRVDAVTMDQLADIYAGDITNWSEIGGPDQKILPLQLPVNSLVRNEMIKLVMNPARKSIAGNVLTLADEASIADSVDQFPGSISVISMENADDNVTVPVAGSCGVPVRPVPFNIVSGDYPLVRPIMASYDRTPNTSLLTELFDFASADVAQNLLAREGFINYGPIEQGAADKNTRLSQILGADLTEVERPVAAEMFQVLFEAERLSPTMSGGPASGPEGAWNRAMMIALTNALQDDAYAGREVLFVGFGTSEAGAQAAIDASALAAAQAEAAFLEFAGDVVRDNALRLTSFGFGGVAPATCYEGQLNNSTYTRVEIWVR